MSEKVKRYHLNFKRALSGVLWVAIVLVLAFKICS